MLLPARTGASHGGVLASVLVAGVLVAALGLRIDQPLNHDVAWFIVAAERLWNGGNYLDDFFEVNPPLAILIHLPAHGLALAGLPPRAAMWAWTHAILVVALVLAWFAAREDDQRYPGAPAAAARLAGTGWLAFVLALLPAYDFAQREHLFALLVLPMLFLFGAAPSPRAAPLRAAVMALAMVGCLLKPHFAGLPVLLLAVRAMQSGVRSWLGLESAIIVLSGLAYGAIVWLGFPEWFVVARWALDLYGELRGGGLERFAQATSFAFAVGASVMLFAVVALARPEPRRRLLPFALATAYAWIAFVLQGKGWRYHLLPAAIFAAASLPLLAFGTQGWRRGPQALASIAVLASIAIGAVHVVQINRAAPRLSNLARSPIGEVLSIARPGDAVHVISTSVTPFFPAVTHLELRWASRYSALWPLAALGRDSGPNPASDRSAAYRDAFADSVAADLGRHAPTVAIVDLRPGQFGLEPGFDMLGFLQASPRFAHEWDAYELVGSSRDYAIYLRRHEPASDAASRPD